MSGYLLDTWAWIEYLEGGKYAEDVNQIIEGDENCYTSVQTIAELSDLYHRGSINIDMEWEQLRQFITTKKTDKVEITEAIAEKAGKIKVSEREEKPDFGLADGVILATAKGLDLKLVSGDSHLTDKSITLNPQS